MTNPTPDPAQRVAAAIPHLPDFTALKIERYKHGGGRVWRDGEDGRDLVLDLYSPEERREAILSVLTHAPALLSELAELRAERERMTRWTQRYGADLIPGACADTFGDGMRAAKSQVRAILAAPSRPQPEPQR